MSKKSSPKENLKFEYHEDFTAAPDEYIFVFGSNLAGYHGAGAALAALKFYGAKLGPTGGEGLHGKSYAIPTKDQWIQTRKIEDVYESIARFVMFTQQNPELKFWITQVGCGLAGFSPKQIAPVFFEAKNCNFPEPWKHILESCKL